MNQVQRDFLGRWLDIETRQGYFDAFELRLLKRGREGILTLEPPLTDKPTHYRFHTDCCRPLPEWIASEPGAIALLPTILKNIVGTYFQLCQYMLCSERICLEPSLIFIDATHSIKLVYFPEGAVTPLAAGVNPRMDTQERFVNLFDQLMHYLPEGVRGVDTSEALYERFSQPYSVARKNLAVASAPQQRPSDLPNAPMSQIKKSTAESKVVNDLGKPGALKGFPGLSCISTRQQFIKAAVYTLAFQGICGVVLLAGNAVLLQITGDLTEARMGWLLVVVGLDLLGLMRIVPRVFKEKGAENSVASRAIAANGITSNGITAPPPFETELLSPRASDFLKGPIGEASMTAYAFINLEEVVYRFMGDQALVGRNQQLVQWCLEDPAIGRQHARLAFVDGKLFLEDLGTKNGTYVNSEDIRGCGAVPLAPGDTVSFADGVAYVLTQEEKGGYGYGRGH